MTPALIAHMARTCTAVVSAYFAEQEASALPATELCHVVADTWDGYTDDDRAWAIEVLEAMAEAGTLTATNDGYALVS